MSLKRWGCWMMSLFEEEKVTDQDWFDVCPNADEVSLPTDEGMRIFDVCLLYGREWDRLTVARALTHSRTNRAFLISVLNNTYPNNPGIQFAARELLHKVPTKLLCSVLAFSHDGTGKFRITFPDKIHTPSTSLLKAFGLRRSEAHWVPVLAANESFVRMVAGAIKEKDWESIIHDKATVFSPTTKQETAPQSTPNGEMMLW